MPASSVAVSEKVLHQKTSSRICLDTSDFQTQLCINKLRAFNKALPIPHSNVSIWFLTPCARCDISFLTGITSLTVSRLNSCTLTIPTSVVKLELDQLTEDVSVSGTDSLTNLIVKNETVKTTPCPKLQALEWWGKTLSGKTLPCPARNIRALSELVVDVRAIDPVFLFPQGLTSLELKVRDVFVGVERLTGLQRLNIGVNNKAPLDLSGLTGLTWLNPNTSPVSRFPTTLVECVLRVRCDTDLSPLTLLTALSLQLERGVRVTFPTQFKKLYLVDGRLDNSNIGDVALETFKSCCSRRITQGELERLPKTVRKIRGEFHPDSLRDHLGALFPLM